MTIFPFIIVEKYNTPMKRLTVILLLPIILFVVMGPYKLMAINSSEWTAISRQLWEKYKSNYIFCGDNCGDNLGLVFDPLSDYHAVSEGVGYGMLLSVIFDDQATFDVIYQAAQGVLYDPETGLHHWRVDRDGNIVGQGSATDAELDMAMALIFADQHVSQGRWTQPDTVDYGQSARDLLDAVWTQEVVDGKYLKPGNLFSGEGHDIVNLSYFTPAWFRLYDEFLEEDKWVQLIEPGYQSLMATEGAGMGLAPDWSTFDGEPAFDYCDRYGRPRESCRYEMRYDAIRVPWRIGLDCLWFGDDRACGWSRRSAEFLNTLNEPDFARMYDMQGNAVVDYRDEAMLGMWLFAALASEDKELQNRLEWDLYNFATRDLTDGFLTGRDSYYYNRSLILFSISYLSNGYDNIPRN